MSPHRLHSLFMGFIQYEVSIHSACRIFYFYLQLNKNLISNFESARQYKVSKKQKKLIEKSNQHNTSLRDCDLIRCKLEHQSYTDREMKYACCARIILK